MVLVVLSHAWTITPTKEWSDAPWSQLLNSGNFAVTIFFVVGGFLLVRAMLAEGDRDGRIDVVREVLRRALRIAIPLYVFLAAVVAVAAMQDPPDYPSATTIDSVVAVATFTWNWYLQGQALLARPDLGHLWFVSVYMQLTVALVLLCVLTLRRRRLAIGWLAGTLVAVTLWRFNVVGHENLLASLLRTTTRADGMLWGALAAYAAQSDRVRNLLQNRAPALFILGALSTLVLILVPSTPEQYLGWLGVLSCASATALVLSVQWLSPLHPLTRPLRPAPLVILGHHSLSVYIWHYPLFWFVAHHTDGWAWGSRVVVSVLSLTIAVVISRQLVEKPANDLLDGWALTSRGDGAPAAPSSEDATAMIGDDEDLRQRPRRRSRFTRSRTP
jgi:peptidoglycan/LPS O-acetylase OafA/YrhL